jgi:hypothetical protein
MAGVPGPGTPERERIDKCLEISLANRAFEIDLLWKRTLVFWGFVAVLFVGVAQSVDKWRSLAVALTGLGVVFSLIWSLVNRGSKSWQESWEIKSVQFFDERYSYTNLFRRATGPQTGIFRLLRSRPYSPSRLLIAISDFSFIFWLTLLLYLMPLEQLCPGAANIKANASLLFALVTLAYTIYVLIACRSRVGDASGSLP